MLNTRTLFPACSFFRSFILLVFLTTATTALAKVVYVNKNVTGRFHNGAAWSTAFTSVQPAFGAAKSGDEVWVAAASYTGAVTMKDGVALFGGFAGTESSRIQRNWKVNVTVLDGGGSTVVTSSVQGATVDGFTLRNGDVGVSVSAGSASIANCVTNAIASTGVDVTGSTATATSCTFIGCSRGLSVGTGGTVTVTNCAISANESAGVYVDGGEAYITDCSISANADGLSVLSGSAKVYDCAVTGGIQGVHVGPRGTATITTCAISDNASAGLFLDGGFATILGCGITRNPAGVIVPSGTATINDGAITGNLQGVNVGASGTLTITTCAISDNAGAGLFVDGGTASVVNCEISRNAYGGVLRSGTENVEACTVDDNKSAGFSMDGGNATITECALDRNANGASLGGGNVSVSRCTFRGNRDGLFIPYLGSAAIADCTIDGNTLCGVDMPGGTASITNSIVRRNQTGVNMEDGSVSVANCCVIENSNAGVRAHFGSAKLTNCIVTANQIGILQYLAGYAFYLSHNDVYGNTANYENTVDPTCSNGNISREPLFVDPLHGDYRLLARSRCVDAGDDTIVTIGEADLAGHSRIQGDHVDIGAYETVRTWSTAILVDVKANQLVQDGTTWQTAFSSVQQALANTSCNDEIWVAKGTYVGTLTLPVGTALYGGFAGTETAREQRNPRQNMTILDGAQKGDVITSGLSGAILDGFTICNGWAGVNVSGGSATISNNTITSNRTGVLVEGVATITNNIVTLNDAVSAYDFEYGGGISVIFGTATIANNIISDNAANNGGGILVRSGSATLANNTITSNSGQSGGGVWAGGSHVTMANNIVAFNESGVGVDPAYLFSAYMMHNNDTYGNRLYNFSGLTDPAGANGNMSQDPALSSPYQDIHIEPGSPCVGAGDNASIVGTTDVYGKARVIGSTVDIGAEESDGTVWPVIPSLGRIQHVSPTGDDANDGTVWSKAKKTVSAALTSPMSVDEVWVAKGTYAGYVIVPEGIALYGGFAGTETVRSQRDASANTTILDGAGIYPVVTIVGSGTVFDGFTVQNGLGNIGPGQAGGLTCFGPNAVISHNIVSSNRIADSGMDYASGGGVVVSSLAAGTSIRDNSITGNSAEAQGSYFSLASAYGGGLLVTANNVTIERNLIADNYASATATVYGGCSHCFDSGGYAYAGGIALTGAGCMVKDNLIANNGAYGDASSQCGGADISAGTGTLTVVNNTFVGNSSGGDSLWVSGPGIYANNIVTGNWGGELVSRTTQSHNAVYGNHGFDYDPLYPSGPDDIHVDPLILNYHLQAGSPCIDAGDDTAVTPGDKDLDGKPRIIGAHVDIGAFEYDTASYSVLDVAKALRIAAGIESTATSTGHWDVAGPASSVDLLDAVLIARKAMWLEPNP